MKYYTILDVIYNILFVAKAEVRKKHSYKLCILQMVLYII